MIFSGNNKIWTIPNIMSLFRICLIPVIVWLYLVREDSSWTGYVLILSGATDIVDGFIARHFHMISDLGKVLDPVADKLTQAVMLVCLLLRYPMMVMPFVLLVIKELFMAVSGYLVVRKSGMVMGANWHGKAATVLLYAMMILHVFWEPRAILSDLSIFACSAMITLSCILYGIRNIRALQEEGPAEGEV